MIQVVLNNIKYNDVKVYANNGKARNNIGNWKIKNVQVDKKLKGFEYYSKKDEVMAKEADYGFMIWNGKSRGTLNNMINLRSAKKEILLYFTPLNKFYYINTDEKLKDIVFSCENKTIKIYKKLLSSKKNKIQQLSLSNF